MKKFLLLQVVFMLCTHFGMAQINEPFLDSIITYRFYENGDSVKMWKIENEYDNKDQITAHSIYDWEGKWVGGWFFCEECYPIIGRREYKYDKDGNMVWAGSYTWTGFGWDLRGESQMEYDNLGNNTSWYNSSIRMEYEYDMNGNIKTSIRYMNYSGENEWTPVEKYTYEHDNFGNNTKEIRFNWDNELLTWNPGYKTERYRTTNGIIKEVINYKWDWIRNQFQWIPYGHAKFEYKLDSIGNILDMIYLGRTRANEWDSSRQIVFEYNKYGQNILKIEYQNYNNEWKEQFKTERYYDSNGVLMSETLSGSMQRSEDFYENRSNRKVIRYFNSDGTKIKEDWHYLNRETNKYIFNSRDYYFYHLSTTGIEEDIKSNIFIFPNPTSGLINISGLIHPAEVKIYSIQGQLLRSESQVEGLVDISEFEAGVYLLNILSEGKVVREVVVKN